MATILTWDGSVNFTDVWKSCSPTVQLKIQQFAVRNCQFAFYFQQFRTLLIHIRTIVCYSAQA